MKKRPVTDDAEVVVEACTRHYGIEFQDAFTGEARPCRAQDLVSYRHALYALLNHLGASLSEIAKFCKVSSHSAVWAGIRNAHRDEPLNQIMEIVSTIKSEQKTAAPI